MSNSRGCWWDASTFPAELWKGSEMKEARYWGGWVDVGSLKEECLKMKFKILPSPSYHWGGAPSTVVTGSGWSKAPDLRLGRGWGWGGKGGPRLSESLSLQGPDLYQPGWQSLLIPVEFNKKSGPRKQTGREYTVILIPVGELFVVYFCFLLCFTHLLYCVYGIFMLKIANSAENNCDEGRRKVVLKFSLIYFWKSSLFKIKKLYFLRALLGSQKKCMESTECSHMSCPHTNTASPKTDTLCHSRYIIRVHCWWCMFCGFGQIYNDLYPPL